MIDQIYWVVKGRILVISVAGIMNFTDLIYAMNIFRDQIEAESALAPVHLILDLSGRTELDLSEFSLMQMIDTLISTRHPWRGCIAVVDPEPQLTVRFVTVTALQRENPCYRVCDSMEGALAYLCGNDSTLDKIVES